MAEDLLQQGGELNITMTPGALFRMELAFSQPGGGPLDLSVYEDAILQVRHRAGDADLLVEARKVGGTGGTIVFDEPNGIAVVEIPCAASINIPKGTHRWDMYLIPVSGGVLRAEEWFWGDWICPRLPITVID